MAKERGNNLPPVECINWKTDNWIVRWDFDLQEGENEYTVFDHKPTIDEIKELLNNYYNAITEEKILKGFVWKEMNIWLSMENQLNYQNSYYTAKLTGVLPTFKFGDETPVYYKFNTLEELEDFICKSTNHIMDTITDGWQMKDSIDFTLYNDLL